jgi:transcriptional regulator with XRE-family HTH domain
VTLKAARTLGFPLVTVGDHVKAERLKRKLLQREVAQLLGVCHATVINWETGRREIEVRHFPKIIAFLGYDPHPAPETLSQRLLAVRRANGWTIGRAAQEIGVDEATWAGWEEGRAPQRMHHDAIRHLLEGHTVFGPAR